MTTQDELDARILEMGEAQLRRAIKAAVDFIGDREDDVQVLRQAFYLFLEPAHSAMKVMGYAAARARQGRPLVPNYWWLLAGDIMTRAGITVEGSRFVVQPRGAIDGSKVLPNGIGHG